MAITDPATGKLECFLDGKMWTTKTIDEFKNLAMNKYVMGSEMFHSVDQCSGHADDKNKCLLSEAIIFQAGKPADTKFQEKDLLIWDVDLEGIPFSATTSHEWAFTYLSVTSFKIWDKVVEY